MSVSDWIATIGVSILLLAFGLNLFRIISADSYTYLILNFLGALLAGIASVLICFIPFVILEAVWVLVSLFGIFKKFYYRNLIK
jgi:hypothetical protein